jgi:hypothetical protein
VNCSPALGVECQADLEVKEPLLADLIDLLEMQAGERPLGGAGKDEPPADGEASRAARERSRAVGGGARAARARATGGRAGHGTSLRDADGAGPARARRETAAAAERLAAMPATYGGYELIFPFSKATERVADSIGGNESLIIAEVRAELQRATAGAPPDAEGGGADDEAAAQPAAGGSTTGPRRPTADPPSALSLRRQLRRMPDVPGPRSHSQRGVACTSGAPSGAPSSAPARPQRQTQSRGATGTADARQ